MANLEYQEEWWKGLDLQDIPDIFLQQLAIIGHMGCARSKQVLKRRVRTDLCGMAGTFDAELQARGKPHQTPPYNVA